VVLTDKSPAVRTQRSAHRAADHVRAGRQLAHRKYDRPCNPPSLLLRADRVVEYWLFLVRCISPELANRRHTQRSKRVAIDNLVGTGGKSDQLLGLPAIGVESFQLPPLPLRRKAAEGGRSPVYLLLQGANKDRADNRSPDCC